MIFFEKKNILTRARGVLFAAGANFFPEKNKHKGRKNHKETRLKSGGPNWPPPCKIGLNAVRILFRFWTVSGSFLVGSQKSDFSKKKLRGPKNSHFWSEIQKSNRTAFKDLRFFYNMSKSQPNPSRNDEVMSFQKKIIKFPDFSI